MLTGILFRVAVMEWCPVMESSGKRESDEGDGVMNEGDKSSITHVIRTAHTNSGVV